MERKTKKWKNGYRAFLIYYLMHVTLKMDDKDAGNFF